jgi:hypothetical protein
MCPERFRMRRANYLREGEEDRNCDQQQQHHQAHVLEVHLRIMNSQPVKNNDTVVSPRDTRV